MRAVTLLLALSPALAMADVEQKFAKLRDAAEPLASIGSFVDKYVGDCGPLNPGCVKNAESFRRAAAGKKFYMIVTEDSTSVLQMGDAGRDGSVTLNLTPFFAGSSSAVTHGAPAKTDPNGNPVLPFIRIQARLPDGWNPGMMARQVGARAMRIQVVFTPEDVWTLPKKGGGTMKGVRAKFDGVLVQVGRTGEVVGTWYAK